MKILRLETRGFGCLSGHIDFHPEGINLWVAPNGQGKTTVATAIREVLYGPLRVNPHLVEHRELAYLQPMDGKVFSVQLDIEVGERRLCIIRDFSRGTVQVLEGGFHGMPITEEFRTGKDRFGIGERLLGLRREEFIKSVFVGQGEVMQVQKEAEKLTGVLQRIADTESGESTVAGAIQVLEEVEQRYPLRRSGEVNISTEKGRLQRDLGKVNRQIEDFEQKRASVANKAVEFAEAEKSLKQLQFQLGRIIHLERKAELSEIEERLLQDEEQQKQVRKLEGEYNELAPYATFSVAQRDNLHRWLDEIVRAQEELGQLETKKGDKEQEADMLQTQLDEKGAIAQFAEQDRDNILTLAGRMESAEGEESAAQNKVKKERQRLEEKGFIPERYEELHEKFKPLTLEEWHLLRDTPTARQNRELRKTQAQSQHSGAKAVIGQIQAERDKHVKIGMALLIAGGGLMVGGLLGAFVLMAVGIGLVGLGLILLVAGILLRQSASALRADELSKAQRDVEEAERGVEHVVREWESERERLQELAGKISSANEENLLREFTDFETLYRETDQFLKLMRDHEQATVQVSRSKSEAFYWLERAGWSQQEPISQTLHCLLKEVDSALGLRNHLETARRDINDLKTGISSKQNHLDSTRQIVKKLLRDAGLNETLEGNQAREAFDKGVDAALRRSNLEKAILPGERKLLLPKQAKERLGERAAELQQQIEQELSNPNGQELASLSVEKDRAGYQREREELNKKIEKQQQRVNDFQAEIGDTLKEVRTNLPRLLQEREDLKRRLRRAEQFEASVKIAKETLKGLESEVYEVWAEALNAFAGDAFLKVLPYYENPRFDRNLHFTFALPGRPGRIDPSAEPGNAPRLSGGELEQVHLVARFAIADYLSHADRRPPIILDEPFPYSHDTPFLKGMELLAQQLSQERQIIVFTCHEVRHDWLLEQAPELRDIVHRVTFEGRCGPPLSPPSATP